MAPVTLNGPQTDVVVTGSSGDDLMNVQDLGGGMMEVSSGGVIPTFESVTFQTPSHSLSVDGGGGFDQISVTNALNLGRADFTATAEQITVPATASITAGNVTLSAANTATRSFDPVGLTNNVLSALGLSSATDLLQFDPSTLSSSTILNAVNPLSYLGSIANATVQGNITATGNISISAEATNQIGLTAPISNNLLIFHLTNATALVQGATLTAGGSVSVTTNNHGDRGTQTSDNNVVVSIAIDRSEATIDGATINANGLTTNAQSAASYVITGSKALNLIDGDTKADVIDGSHVNVTTGGVQITASENSIISATSSGNGGLAAAATTSIRTRTPM